MIGLVLGLLLMQTAPQATGTVTGVVRAGDGRPTAGVRVYAIRYRDAVEAANLPPALESLTETGKSGQYRLDVLPGRYHIASGSVVAPTYYPGTIDIAAARIVTVAANTVVPDVDFGSFIARSDGNRPSGNGILSGTLRYPDGTPAAGIPILAVPAGTLPSGGRVVTINTGISVVYQTAAGYFSITPSFSLSTTDSTGAYRLTNLPVDTYQIAAGYAESPTFYPGTRESASAASHLVAMNTVINNLDFTIEPEAHGVTASGVVRTTSGVAPTGAVVSIRPTANRPVVVAGLPFRNVPQQTTVDAAGAFAFNDVLPGTLTFEASIPGLAVWREDIVVRDQPVSGVRLTIPAAPLQARLLMVDGSTVPHPQLFSHIALKAVDTPTGSTLLLPISAEGTFSRLMDAGSVRMHFTVLPEEYEIRSARSGSTDLLREPLRIAGNELVEVEVRLANRSSNGAAPLSSTGVPVGGMLRDSASTSPSPVERLVLCCANSEWGEKFSAPVRSDGSFEFSAIAPGTYTPQLQLPAGSSDSLQVFGFSIEVGEQPLRNLTLYTATGITQIRARIGVEGPVALPEELVPSIVFTNVDNDLRIVADFSAIGLYTAMVPIGGNYKVTVEDLPENFAMKTLHASDGTVFENATIYAESGLTFSLTVGRK